MKKSYISLLSFCIGSFEISSFLVPTTTCYRKSHLCGTGDPVRAATGIRPSLHPVTINAISEALRQRAKQSAENNESKLREPLEIAQAAGKIAIDAIVSRQKSSVFDGMQFTPEEEQAVAGRVVGVVMRFKELETVLREKCQSVKWIAQYEEWSSFGVLADEHAEALNEQILTNPLFCMNRAECLLALFLSRIEAPSLLNSKQQVAGGSAADFLDIDRRDVLLDGYQ